MNRTNGQDENDRTEVSDHDERQAGRSGDPAPEPAGQDRPGEDRAREGDPGGDDKESGGQADRLPDPSVAPVAFPHQTPLYHANHSERYERQRLIESYEKQFDCNLIVMCDAIFPWGVTYFEELLVDAEPSRNLHLLLDTPGGDGETAVRLVRAAQSRCDELTILIPNQAKSAGTILVLGANHILMGPTSDLGPVDPQFQVPGRPGLVPAKDVIAAVEYAEKSIAANPDTYLLHVSLLAEVTGVMVQQARSALARSGDLIKEALRSNTKRDLDEVDQLAANLMEPLISKPRDHGAIFDANDAEQAGLPVIQADPRGDQWKLIWLLWAKYFTLGQIVYEGRRASNTFSSGE